MWLAVWLKKAEVQQYPHKVRNLHIDGGGDDDLIVIEPTGSDPVVDQSVGDSVEPGGVVTPVLPEPDFLR